jgi:hypothetical protein
VPGKMQKIDSEYHAMGRVLTQDELGSLAKSHGRPGMSEDKWVSLGILIFSLLILGLSLLIGG